MKQIYTRLLAALLCIGLMLTFVACEEQEGKADDTTAQQGQINDTVISDDNADDKGGNQDSTPPVSGSQTPMPDDKQNNDDTPPAPPAPEEPVVIPPAPEIVRSTAYNTRVAADELILTNGIKLGMSYDEVAAYSGYPGAKPKLSVTGNQTHYSIQWGGVEYKFSCNNVGGKAENDKLVFICIEGGAYDIDIFRNIRCGDSVESVISKIPAEDPVPKMWKEQYLYNYEQIEPRGYALLRYVMTDVFSNYEMDICTPEWWVEIVFWRESQTVRQINIRPREN